MYEGKEREKESFNTRVENAIRNVNNQGHIDSTVCGGLSAVKWMSFITACRFCLRRLCLVDRYFKSRISLNVSCQGVCYTFVTLPVVQRCQTSFVVCLRLNLLRHVRVLITTAMKENQWTRGRCHDDRQTDRGSAVHGEAWRTEHVSNY